MIPSAPGKRNSKDTKVTDMLYECYAAASTGASYKKLLEAIKARYQEIIDGLELKLSLEKEFSLIRENFAGKAGKDYAASRGEYLNRKGNRQGLRSFPRRVLKRYRYGELSRLRVH